MKCTIGRGRPVKKVFMKLGKVEVTRLDALNWVVETPERTMYYHTLPGAVYRAVEVAAEAKANDAIEWLREYERISAKLEKTLAKSFEGWKEAA